jgi:hypothetical protein
MEILVFCLIPSIPLCYDDYFTNMTVKHNKFVKPNYVMSLCKFRWTTCLGHLYDHHQVHNSSYGPDVGHMNDRSM